MKIPNWKKIAFFVFVLSIFFTFFYFHFEQLLSLEAIKLKKDELLLLVEAHPILSPLFFSVVYIVVASLSLPGAGVLSLSSGALFGLPLGVFVSCFSSSIGAYFAFLSSRFLFRSWVESKFENKLKIINQGIKADGSYYLFTLRLIPTFPFFIINLLMGLTSISAVRFFIVSVLGMLPGSIVFVNAGTRLADIESIKQILSFPVVISFLLLGFTPWIIKKVIALMRRT